MKAIIHPHYFLTSCMLFIAGGIFFSCCSLQPCYTVKIYIDGRLAEIRCATLDEIKFLKQKKYERQYNMYLKDRCK